MQSIRKLYKIGRGPSSSHTMGPYFSAQKIKEMYPDADNIHVLLFNSLALTGEGHLTYDVLEKTLFPIVVDFESKIDLNEHPNTILFSIMKNDEQIAQHKVKSVGGGDILFEDEEMNINIVYPHKSFAEIRDFCNSENINLYQYVQRFEDSNIDGFLKLVWLQMKSTIETGLSAEGILPGRLEVKRKAKSLFTTNLDKESEAMRENRLIGAYAFAVGEENASGGMVVTAPTCGASGVLPAVLYFMAQQKRISQQKIIKALAIAGLIGNLIKHNATISGAVGGCQAEVGSACAMTAAAHASLYTDIIDHIEYAAEVALEHHLGLTCDPIEGYVQIPCIERNAVAGIRAMNASRISYILSGSRKISLDMIIQTMYQTGLDMHPKYKETAEAGMAYFYKSLKK